MLRITATICILSFLSWQCKSQPNLTEKRKNVIRQAINAILLQDTSKLYNLVDTTYYFDIDGKEGFLFTINYLSKKFKECGIELVDSSIKISDGVGNIKEYLIPMCLDKDSLGDNSLDIIFKFADYENVDKIMLIDTKKYLDPSKIKPTTPTQQQKH